MDRIDHTPCEINLKCDECGSRVDYWAYGDWESDCVEDKNGLWFDLKHNKRNFMIFLWQIATKRDVFRWIYVFFRKRG